MAIRSLKTKSTVAFSLLGLFPLLVTGLIAGYIVNSAHKQDVLTMERQLLSGKHAEISKYLERVYSITAIKVGYPGKEIIAPLSQRDVLTKLYNEYPEFLEMTLTDMEGNETTKLSRFQDVDLLELSNVKSLQSFQLASKGKFYIGKPEYTLRGPVVQVSAPVVNNVGDVIMTFSVLLDLKPLQELVGGAKLGTNGYVFLLDQDSRMLAGPNTEFISRIPSAGLLPRNKNASLDTVKGFKGEDVLSTEEVVTDLGWRLVAHWPEDDAFAIVRTLQYQLLATTLFSVVLVFLGGLYVRRKVVDPMLVLEKSAEKIGSGNFDETISIHTGDEIEELGNVFSKMEVDLKKLQELKVAQAKAEALAESLRKEKLLSQIKEDFINNTSHQLRTPLSVIRWSSELLATAITDEKLKGIMQGVTTGVHELNAIVHDLITVSNFGFGYKNKVKESVNIVELIKKQLTKQKSQIDKKDITLSIPELSEMKVIGDPVALDILFENLIDNAVTYTNDKGYIKISVESQGEGVIVCLEDNGIGITKKDQGSIFNQFFRATNSIEKKNVGTGLGLYISRLIIEGHNGKIWFESEQNQGSKFYLLLPK